MALSFYDDYKPFRNLLRRYNLQAGLEGIWRCSSHLDNGSPLPSSLANSLPLLRELRDLVYPWDMEIVAKEMIMHASVDNGHELKHWGDIASIVNHIRRLEDAAFQMSVTAGADVLFGVHRVLQRQFPWQEKGVAMAIMRAYKVFGADVMDDLIQREMGMSAKQFFLLGIAVSGGLLKQAGLVTTNDYEFLGISRDASYAFFERVTGDLDVLRASIHSQQTYDHNWLYAWNPLEAKPLVRFDKNYPERVLCPIPRYLLRRTSSGIFYDIVKAKGFDNPYGNSFEVYVGDVLRAVCGSERFSLRGETPYLDSQGTMHGVDWVLSDPSGHLFIESKTKRLSLSARTHSDPAALDRDLLVMARAVTQHYKNIQAVLDGKANFQHDGRPIFPVILTFEDWLIFGPTVHEMLERHVRELLDEAGIPSQVLEEMPYTIMSANDLEIGGQVIAQVGIKSLMSKKIRKEYRQYVFLPFVMEHYPQEMKQVRRMLFRAEWEAFLPEAATLPPWPE